MGIYLLCKLLNYVDNDRGDVKEQCAITAILLAESFLTIKVIFLALLEIYIILLYVDFEFLI